VSFFHILFYPHFYCRNLQNCIISYLNFKISTILSISDFCLSKSSSICTKLIYDFSQSERSRRANCFFGGSWGSFGSIEM
jgi:hypothetical protein